MDGSRMAEAESLRQFLNEVARHRLLTAKEEVELAKRIERGDQRGQGPHDQLEPAPGRLDRQALPGAAICAAGPDPGGHPGPDPRGREVRLAPRLQVLDLRDLVDPPGDRAWHRQQGAHDPDAGARRSSASARSPAPSSELAAELGRQPTDEEVATEAELPLEQVREVRDAARAVTSLDSTGGRGRGHALGRFLRQRRRGARSRRSRSACAARSCAARSPSCPIASARSSTLRYGLTSDSSRGRSSRWSARLGLSRDRGPADRAEGARAARPPARELEALETSPEHAPAEPRRSR